PGHCSVTADPTSWAHRAGGPRGTGADPPGPPAGSSHSRSTRCQTWAPPAPPATSRPRSPSGAGIRPASRPRSGRPSPRRSRARPRWSGCPGPTPPPRAGPRGRAAALPSSPSAGRRRRPPLRGPHPAPAERTHRRATRRPYPSRCSWLTSWILAVGFGLGGLLARRAEQAGADGVEGAELVPDRLRPSPPRGRQAALVVAQPPAHGRGVAIAVLAGAF